MVLSYADKHVEWTSRVLEAAVVVSQGRQLILL